MQPNGAMGSGDFATRHNPNMLRRSQGIVDPGRATSPRSHARVNKQKRYTTINGVRTEVDELGRPVRPADLSAASNFSQPLIQQGTARPTSPKGGYLEHQVNTIRSSGQNLQTYKQPLKGGTGPLGTNQDSKQTSSPILPSALPLDYPFTPAQLEKMNKYKNDSTLEDIDEADWLKNQSRLEQQFEVQPEIFIPRKNSFGEQPLPTRSPGFAGPWFDPKQPNVPAYRVPVPSSNYFSGLTIPEPVVVDTNQSYISFGQNTSARPSMGGMQRDGPNIVRLSSLSPPQSHQVVTGSITAPPMIQNLSSIRPPLRTSRTISE